MSDNFKALVINQDGENFTREIKTIDNSFLKHRSLNLSQRETFFVFVFSHFVFLIYYLIY